VLSVAALCPVTSYHLLRVLVADCVTEAYVTWYAGRPSYVRRNTVVHRYSACQ
jgi:hypothetical protein